MKIKGAIFDLDGTLVDSLGFWDILWKVFSKKYCINNFKPNKEEYKKVKTMTFENSMNFIYTKYNIGENGKELLEILKHTLKNYYESEVKLKNGVKEFLIYLYNKSIPMCVASATDIELVNLAIKHCEIDGYFMNVISCAEIGIGKDKPDIFYKALELLKTPIEETWLFEETLDALKTGKQIGFNTVGIYDKYNCEQDEIKKLSSIYISVNNTLATLLEDRRTNI